MDRVNGSTRSLWGTASARQDAAGAAAPGGFKALLESQLQQGGRVASAPADGKMGSLHTQAAT